MLILEAKPTEEMVFRDVNGNRIGSITIAKNSSERRVKLAIDFDREISIERVKRAGA